MRPSTLSPPPETRHDELQRREPGAAELVLEAAGLAEELLRLELALAKDELVEDGRALRTSAVAVGVALPCFVAAMAMLAIAGIWAGGPMAALFVGLTLLVVAFGAACVAHFYVPDKPLAATRRRLRMNRALLKGHLS
jgi:hypothetical protein